MDLDSSYSCLKAQHALLKNKTFKESLRHKFRIDYHVNAGVYFRMKGKPERAIDHYEKALSVAQNHSFRKEEGTIFNNIANIHYQNGDYPISLDYHLKGLRVRKEENDTLGIGMSLGNIGLIYEIRKDYSNAVSYYRQAQSYFEKANQVKALAWTGRVIGTAYLEMEQFASAIKSLQESRAQSVALSDANGVNYCHLNLAVVYSKMYQKHEAVRYLDSADYYLSFLEDESSNPRININYLHQKASVSFRKKAIFESFTPLRKSVDFSAVERIEKRTEGNL